MFYLHTKNYSIFVVKAYSMPPAPFFKDTSVKYHILSSQHTPSRQIHIRNKGWGVIIKRWDNLQSLSSSLISFNLFFFLSLLKTKDFSLKLSLSFISWYFPVNFISCLSQRLADLKINASAAPGLFIFSPHLGSVSWSQMFNTRIWSCSHPLGGVVLFLFF